LLQNIIITIFVLLVVIVLSLIFIVVEKRVRKS